MKLNTTIKKKNDILEMSYSVQNIYNYSTLIFDWNKDHKLYTEIDNETLTISSKLWSLPEDYFTDEPIIPNSKLLIENESYSNQFEIEIPVIVINPYKYIHKNQMNLIILKKIQFEFGYIPLNNNLDDKLLEILQLNDAERYHAFIEKQILLTSDLVFINIEVLK